jgi:putative nucleotidyltransferase with HDIG domain
VDLIFLGISKHLIIKPAFIYISGRKIMRTLSLKLKVYLVILYIFTIFSIYFFISQKNMDVNISIFDYKLTLFFVILMALTESFSVIFRGLSFSTGFAVIIAACFIKGPLFAIIISILGFSLRIEKSKDGYLHILNKPLYKTLFNYCNFMIPIIYGNYVFIKLGGSYNINEITKNLIPIVMLCLTNFLLNVLNISILFSFINNKSLLYNIFSNIRLGALNFLAMAPFGIIAAYIFYPSNYGGLMLFIFPIILARFTFSQYIEAKTKYIQTVNVIMLAMEARDKYTEGHSKRVAEIACMIATELKYNEWKIEELNMASLLHDVGKIGIDDHILNKPGKLTEAEYNEIKKHPEIGYKILKDIKDIEGVLSIVKYHHERYDGKGYPDGKNYNELSLDVFIVQLADSIDAMATDRPYRNSLTDEEILSEITKFSGTQFHPVVVDAYLRAIEKKEKP